MVMATISEWLAGETNDGKPLPLATVNKYRDRRGLPPIERTAPSTGSPVKSQQTHREHRKTTRGVGTHLKLLLKEFGISANLCGEGCGSFAAMMDGWGIEGCRKNREAILERLRQRYKETSWKTALNAAFQSVVTGNVWGMDVLNPIEWLVDEAIRRAEQEVSESRQPTLPPAESPPATSPE